MGEYSNLFIGGRHITGWKNCVGAEASILFTEDDFTSDPQPSWYSNWEYHKDDQRVKELPCFQYKSSAGALKERLDLLGYTLDEAREAWDLGVRETLQVAFDYSSQAQSDKPKLSNEPKNNPQSSYDLWTEHYSKLTFKLWTELMQRIIVEKIEAISHFDDKRKADLEKTDHLLCYILRGYGASGHEFGFPSGDFDLILRSMIEPLDYDTPIVLDCSPLVNWVDQNQYGVNPKSETKS